MQYYNADEIMPNGNLKILQMQIIHIETNKD